MEANRALPIQARLALFAFALPLALALPVTVAAQGSPPAGAATSDSATARPAAPVIAGCADGEMDADAQHRAGTYGIAGFLTGPIGVGFAVWKTPKPHGPKAAALAPESAFEYSRCYGQRARKKNLRASINGLALATFTALTVNYFIESKTAP